MSEDSPPEKTPDDASAPLMGAIVERLRLEGVARGDGWAGEGTSSEAGAGSWTFDGEVALEKIARWRSARRHRFVLDMVRAAILRGATRVEARTSRRGLTLEFEGDAWSASELEALPVSAIGRGVGERVGRQAMAIGIVGAAGVGVRYVELRSLGGGGKSLAARFDLRRGWTPEVVASDGASAEGVSRRTRLQLRWARRLGRAKALAELESLLRARLRHCHVPVVLDGEHVSPVEGDARWLGRCRVGARSGTWVWAGFARGPEPDVPAELVLTSGGVTMFVQRREAWPPHLRVVVESSALGTDLAGEEVLEDGAFDDARSTALQNVDTAQLEALGAFEADRAHAPHGRLEARARSMVPSMAWHDLSALADADDGPRAKLLDRLLDAPIWPLVSGEFTSLRALEHVRQTGGRLGRAFYGARELGIEDPTVLAGHRATVHFAEMVDERHRATLEASFPGAFVNVDDELLAAATAEYELVAAHRSARRKPGR